MEILVNMKQLGANRDKLRAVPFQIEGQPDTVRALIAAAVQSCVRAYRERGAAGEHPLTAEQIAQMEEIGKIAFGFHYNDAAIDTHKAIDDALLAYEDGLVRIFIGEEQLGELDDTVTLHEHDEVTFLRLTFLAGRMW